MSDCIALRALARKLLHRVTALVTENTRLRLQVQQLQREKTQLQETNEWLMRRLLKEA